MNKESVEKTHNNIEFGEKVEKHLVELFKEMYYKEIDSENSFYSNLPFTSGIIITVGGAGLFLLFDFPEFNIQESLHIFFGLSFASLLLVFLITLYLFIRAVTGYEYEYIGKPEEIYSYTDKLKKYYESKNLKTEVIEDNLINDLRGYLISTYSSACSKNAQNNDKRWKYLRYTYIFIIIMTIFLFLSSIAYLLVQNSIPSI